MKSTSIYLATRDQWFLFAFLAVSSLGQLVVVTLSVLDSLVKAFFAAAFLSQLV